MCPGQKKGKKKAEFQQIKYDLINIFLAIKKSGISMEVELKFTSALLQKF